MAGDKPNCGTEEVEEVEEPPLTAVPGIGLMDAPILLLVYFHKALRAEFTELRRIAVEASESCSHGEGLVIELRRRFEFLKLFYKYHSAAEDEVIFMALDVLVKNVVNAYSLEHKSIDDLFDCIFHCLDVLMKEERDISKPFQELVFCIGTIQTIICQHMLKEEEQVFPLLMQQFTSKEQASFVWQFMCSIPVMHLEDFLPWMTSFFSSDEQVEFMHCMKSIVPKEKLLQEVVNSWIDSKKQTYDRCEQGAQFCNGLGNYQDILKLYTSDGNYGENQQMTKAFSLQTTGRNNPIDGIRQGRNNPIDGIRLWHDAIKKDLQEILVELYQIRISNRFSDLASLVVQLNFFADTLIFYSNALDKIFYPIWNELAEDFTLSCYAQFLDERKIEGLQKLLYYKAQSAIPLKNYVEKLCGELELFVSWMNKHLNLLQTEVFPLIGMNCSHEMQQWLLYSSLKMMPLGLLKCMITWFTAHLSEDESKSILRINLEGSFANKSLATLLCEWVRISYSGKTSTEKFRRDLQKFFNSRCSFLYEQIKEDAELSNFQLDMQHCNGSNSSLPEKNSAAKHNVPASSSVSKNTRNYDTSYTSGMNLHVFFPRTSKIQSSHLSSASSSGSSFSSLESRPMDHILFFHKALKKDLDYLVFVSAKLSQNVGFLMDFHHRFHLLRYHYQIHSASEDDIAFPALEAMGNFQNISHSYTIDHKLEGEQFIKVSIILDEISKLHASVSNSDVDALCHREPKYRQLCVKLHDLCMSMHKVLCDHIHHEEIELLPLFRKHFSVQEQEKIIGRMLGRLKAEILQEMIPWLMASLTPDEQHAMMSLWRKATKHTKFDEWLGEWWEGGKMFNITKVEDHSNALPPWNVDPLEVVSKYMVKEGIDDKEGILCDRSAKISENDFSACYSDLSGTPIVADKEDVFEEDQHNKKSSECTNISTEVDKKRCNERTDVSDLADETGEIVQESQKFRHEKHLLLMSQEELEAAIRRVSRDAGLDIQKKAYIIQNLLTSRWTVKQQKLHSEVIASSNEEKVPGHCPSYRDPVKLTFGCKHYRRNCKLVSACCNTLYTCRHCHDDVADHSMDRKATTEMMCMKCLVIQPVGATCSTPSCHKLSMARYFCKICNFFDDEREIYHCPYCNLCRVGKGLGIDYFHCMNCNACMSRSLSVHICREKCFEDFCPICHEFIFTSSSPVKALPCGHLMHSACFQAYTCSHYTCPICSKSLGDMQVYFGMLDALLAEEKIPDEHAGQTQVILCNDCEKRGNAPFHWLHHKCPHCRSYNTRLV